MALLISHDSGMRRPHTLVEKVNSPVSVEPAPQNSLEDLLLRIGVHIDLEGSVKLRSKHNLYLSWRPGDGDCVLAFEKWLQFLSTHDLHV